MVDRMFPSSSNDVGFIDACAAYLTPKMSLSQVRPSGANLRRVAMEPKATRAPTERPSASTFREEDNIADASALKIDLVTPMFQPLRGDSGRTWIAIEYGFATDNSSMVSSESAAERDDTDEEIMSFDLGPEPFDPLVQDRLPSDGYLDDLQQGLIPGGSEPKSMEYDTVPQEMPVRLSLIDTMRQDIETKVDIWVDTPMSPESSPHPTIGFSYDYMRDEPPAIQRIVEAPTHSSPYQEPPKLHARGSGLARPATALHVGPTDSYYSGENGKALHANHRGGHSANIASSRRNRSSYPFPGPAPWQREGSRAVRRQVSEPEASLNQWIQRPRRHRPRAPCGQRNQINRHKSHVWHVICGCTIHQRIDTREGHRRDSELMKLKKKAGLQRPVYTAIIMTSTSSCPRAPVVASWGHRSQ